MLTSLFLKLTAFSKAGLTVHCGDHLNNQLIYSVINVSTQNQVNAHLYLGRGVQGVKI